MSAFNGLAIWMLLPQSTLCRLDSQQGKAKFLKQELRTWRAEREKFGCLPLSVKFTLETSIIEIATYWI